MDILSIIFIILTICLGGVSLYLKSKNQLILKINKYIAIAEDMYKDTLNAGGTKFEFVVDTLYGFVPSYLRKFLSKKLIGTLVQEAFDYMKDYAKLKLDNILYEKLFGESEDVKKE